jgi:hypothetical protein
MKKSKTSNKAKWFFEHTSLRNMEIARLLGVSPGSISLYRTKFDMGLLICASDPDTRKLLTGVEEVPMKTVIITDSLDPKLKEKTPETLPDGASCELKDNSKSLGEKMEEILEDFKESLTCELDPNTHQEETESQTAQQTAQQERIELPSAFSFSMHGMNREAIISHLEYVKSLIKADVIYDINISLDHA